jgi:hypothetical protein
MKINKRSAMRGIPIYITIIICFLLFALSCTAPAPPQTTPPSVPEPTPQTPSPKIVSATDYLKSISDDLYQTYSKVGIDDNVADYILFTQSLSKDFQIYTLRNRLCIQDRKLTDFEKQFLKEPDNYLQQMFDSYMSDVSKVDPELATQVKKLPYFKTLEVEDVEAVEDFLWLVNIPKYRPTLEKLYGKGIQRKIQSVALEALLWRAYTGAYDAYNPLEDSNYAPIFTRLAEFQEKYNKQMDEAELITDKKPSVLGINYVWEPMGWLKKTDDDIRFDYALMRWVLGANAVKIWGVGGTPFVHVEFAHEEGLEVWLEWCPVYAWESSAPDTDINTYCERLALFAQAAERAKAEVLVVGHEVDLYLKRFSKETGALRKAVDEMITTARKNYSGLVTYCCWDGWLNSTNINWEPADIIFPQVYKGKWGVPTSDTEYLNNLLGWKNRYPQKPFAISEYGCLTISNGEAAGGAWDIPMKQPFKYDPGAQAESIERQLRIIFNAGIWGIFLHCWDEKDNTEFDYDKNTLGYGIWDYKSQEPKPSFWSVYKYYKER